MLATFSHLVVECFRIDGSMDIDLGQLPARIMADDDRYIIRMFSYVDIEYK